MDNIKIRKATEEDREDISFVYADAFSEDWSQLSTDITKVTRGILNGLILENYIVATYNEKVVAFSRVSQTSLISINISSKL